jgi:small-conductance mechanosensitive channel
LKIIIITTDSSTTARLFLFTNFLHFKSSVVGNGPKVLDAVKQLTQIVQDASEIVAIIAVAWTLVGVKDRLISFIGRTALKDSPPKARLLETVGGVVNYGIYAAAFFSCLTTCGINITPLLASLGGASVVIGLASQTILGELASSLTLFIAPPFGVGDNVRFLSGGALVMEGLVLAIEPMRTILKTAEGNTLYVSNGKVVGWEVENASRKA